MKKKRARLHYPDGRVVETECSGAQTYVLHEKTVGPIISGDIFSLENRTRPGTVLRHEFEATGLDDGAIVYEHSKTEDVSEQVHKRNMDFEIEKWRRIARGLDTE